MSSVRPSMFVHRRCVVPSLAHRHIHGRPADRRAIAVGGVIACRPQQPESPPSHPRYSTARVSGRPSHPPRPSRSSRCRGHGGPLLVELPEPSKFRKIARSSRSVEEEMRLVVACPPRDPGLRDPRFDNRRHRRPCPRRAWPGPKDRSPGHRHRRWSGPRCMAVQLPPPSRALEDAAARRAGVERGRRRRIDGQGTDIDAGQARVDGRPAVSRRWCS